jgi:hypothetical protein
MRTNFRRPALPVIVIVLVIAAAGIGAGVYFASRPSSTPAAAPLPPKNSGKCAPSAILVNPCRPWVGAAANRIPGAPDSAVAQFDYVEHLVGHPLDIFRDYHSPPGGALGDPPLNSSEITMASRPNTYDDVNWAPVAHWAQADGGDQAVNNEIAKVAANIKSIAPHKLFLTIVWEPQHDVTSDPGDPGCQVKSGAVNGATSGTPAQYVAMWQNVEKIFRAAGVTNVVWTMDYQSDKAYNCLVPQLWPGNSLVDWVLYDTYSRKAQDTWAKTVGPFYDLMLQDSSSQVDFDAKPWGLGEFGTCSNPDTTAAQDFYLQAKASFNADQYPRLKMYLAYNDAGGPKAGLGCLSNYTADGQLDATKQSDFNQSFDALLGGYKK